MKIKSADFKNNLLQSFAAFRTSLFHVTMRRFSAINKDETVDDYLKTSWLFSLLARLNANVTS